MLKKLKDLFAKEKQLPITLGLNEVPGWLDAETEKITEDEEAKVSGSREEVMTAITTLKELVADLGSGDHAGTGYAKLEKVAENSLPLYKKSMISALSRQFPEKTGEFYHAVAECLKGCVKSSQGPGRYLVRVFPEEMKLIQSEVSRLGKEVNTMNPVFTESKSKRNSLEKIRTIHHSLAHVTRELAGAVKKLPQLTGESSVLEEEEEDLSRQVISLENDPRFSLYLDLTRKEQEFLAEHENLTREMVSIAGMIVHVMRRAEKVAQKDQNEVLGKKIHVLIGVLSKSEVPPGDTFLPVMSEILPSVIEMVAKGAITLRNREEQLFFADAKTLPSRFGDVYRDIGDINEHIRDVTNEIENNTFIHEKEALEKRRKQKKSELNEKKRNVIETKQKIETTQKEIPELIHQLEEHMTAFTGEKIRISPRDSEEGKQFP